MIQPIQRFSLLFAARTGSSYLQTAFNNHPNMLCDNETRFVSIIYKDSQHITPNEKAHLIPDSAQITHSGIKIPVNLQRIYQFKHHFWRDNVFKKPMLICTRNPLRSYISWQLVRENQDKWSHKSYVQPVQIDIKAATRYVAGVNKMLQPFLEMQGQVLILKYEDGVKVNYRKALKFLGVPYRPPQTTLIKQTIKPLHDLVANYSELKKSRLWYFLPSDE